MTQPWVRSGGSMACSREKRMGASGYRLWQNWQQMHYPRHGLPESESARGELLTIDGMAGSILEQRFCARMRGTGLADESREILARCDLDLDRLCTDLSGGASRYFARVRLLIGIALRPSEEADQG